MRIRMLLCLLLVSLLLSTSAMADVALPINFSQRDPEWADEQYSNTPGKTIEQRGCPQAIHAQIHARNGGLSPDKQKAENLNREGFPLYNW